MAVQLRRFSGEEGNAEIPGVLESINCINSVWRLELYQCGIRSYGQGFAERILNSKTVPFGHALRILATRRGRELRSLMYRGLARSGVLCILYGKVCHSCQCSSVDLLGSNVCMGAADLACDLSSVGKDVERMYALED